jgi:hypothetical protein
VRLALLLLFALLCACPHGNVMPGADATQARSHLDVGSASSAHLQGKPLPQFPGPARDAEADTANKGARYIPMERTFEKYFGEDRFGARGMLGGTRTLTYAGGAVRAAAMRFADPPTYALALAERLGGGFLFLFGTVIYRANSWLADWVPILSVPKGAFALMEGLDRAYVLSSAQGPRAFDPKTGEVQGTSAWPSSPTVISMIAFDARAAVAIADGLGLVRTQDAGASWEPIPVAFAPLGLSRQAETSAIAVRGFSRERREPLTYEVPRSGEPTRWEFGELQPRGKDGATELTAERSTSRARPNLLALAIEDGYPLEDGSALLAHFGTLSRIDLGFGSTLERLTNAFPQPNARCHPVVLGQAQARSLIFACGEPHGATALYQYQGGRLQPLISFEDPRVILGGGGALAVRGGCHPLSASAAHFCVIEPNSAMRELEIRGDLDQPRFVPLTGAAFAVLSPPHGNMHTARVTVLKDGTTRSMALTWPKLTAKVHDTLENGLWLEGFEERRPGILGGWVEHQGLILGISVELATGSITVGELLNDAGTFSVGGVFGVRFSSARRGFETRDGGMIWKQMDLPDLFPKAGQTAAESSRVAGPLGALGPGWARVGWGTSRPVPDATPAHVLSPPLATESATLQCTEVRPAQTLALPEPRSNVPILKSAKGADPKLQKRLAIEISSTTERFARAHPVATLEAWAPPGVDWDQGAIGKVAWGSAKDAIVKTAHSRTGLLPATLRKLVHPTPQWGRHASASAASFALAFGDAGNAAMLMAHTASGGKSETAFFALEDGASLVEIQRADGEAFGEFESAMQSLGQWFVVTFSSAESTLFRVDGSVARVIATLPRVSALNGGRATAGLAQGKDETRIAVILEGPSLVRSGQDHFAFPVNRFTGARLAPENLGPLNAASVFEPCGDIARRSTDGYRMELALSNAVALDGITQRIGTVYNAYANVQVSASGTCMEALRGTLTQGGETVEAGKALERPPANARFIFVSLDGGARHLRCTPRL